MKFTLSWLKNHIFLDSDINTIAEELTSLGLEVENIYDRSKEIANFKVGLVKECNQHNNADKLKVCIVDIGKDTHQVICGANNVREGLKVVFASPGTSIPNTGQIIKSAKIRGEQSDGMLCSEYELAISDEHEGIIELPDEAIIGDQVSSYLGLDDPIIEIAITPNRQDCLGINGIARDLAAKGLGSLIIKETKSFQATLKSPKKIEINIDKDKKACPAFFGRYIKGVNNGTSPLWLQNKLRSIGLRPISKLVDITNYITFDQNRPMHVFDADKVKGNVLIRFAENGEVFNALDDKKYILDNTATVVADDEKVLALAGIIGGKSSGCDLSTVNVFLEVALFDPVRTAMSGRKYNIESDARYRFERGVDPNSLSLGIEAATNLILELCGGQVSEIVKAGAIPKWDKEILFNLTDIKRVAAIDLDKSDVLKIFSNLGFKVSDKSEKLLVSVPSWRSDIDGKNDLIEELVRVYGYDKIPVESINKNFNMNSFQSNSKLILKNSSKRFMAYRGLNESITWSFISEKNYELFGGKNKKLQIINPISNDLNYMRPSILPNLIDAISRNISRGYSNICLFEVGPQYSSDNIEGQEEVLALVRHGTFGGNHWMKRTHQFDLYDVKADFLSLLTENGFTDNMITINNLAPSWYHPGRSGKISNNKGEALGYFGEINPKVLNQMNFSGRIVSAEIFLNKLTLDKKDNLSKGALNLYDLQSVTRDFSFIVNKKINSKDIVNAAFNTNKQLIISVDVFDVFEDSTIGNDNKSIAISVLIQPKNKTMTEKEIDKISQNIIKNVSSNTGAKLRN